MFSYSPYAVYRCCQHNVSHGWPYYAEELWLATADRGLCASLYAASQVTAKVGDAATVTISEDTDYPFSDRVKFKLAATQPVSFPLYLRIPRWCAAASVAVNGETVPLDSKALAYAVLDRTWKDGDRLSLRLPMKLSVRKWARNHDSVSVDYGPLTFSLKIGERYARYGGTPAWPETEVFPTTPWNYGLVLEAPDPAKSFEVVTRPGPVPAQPFTPETAPIELRARAKKLPAWKQDSLGLVGKLQPSPVKSGQPLETVTLIPMGAARLRISAFPVIGEGEGAHDWTVPKTPPVSASHCNEGDTVEAMIDGLEPKNSNDHSHPPLYLVGPSRQRRVGPIRFWPAPQSLRRARLLVRRYRRRELPCPGLLEAALQRGGDLETGGRRLRVRGQRGHLQPRPIQARPDHRPSPRSPPPA